ncbi:hypothetical protein [Flavilitoribacter nigricans]|nr:hypothetical protein [Flavilitoribacter nigricans]
MPASADLLDRLTDEFQYLVDLSATAAERLDNHIHSQLALKIADNFQQQNRELCRLIIDRDIPAKREVSEEQRKAIVSLIPARDRALNARFESLLRAEFDSLETLINRHKGLIEEREILDFVDQVEITTDNFRNQIEILQ